MTIPDSISVIPEPCDVSLPFTTRGVGFAIQQIYQRFGSVLPFDRHCSIHQLYRASLLQLAFKMHVASDSPTSTQHPSARLHYHLDEPTRSAIAPYAKNFKLIANIIDHFGTVKIGEECFRSFIPSLFPFLTGIRSMNEREPHPAFVTVSTLRRAVTLASAPATAMLYRRYNPFPNSVWGAGNADVLQNADEIMPAQYGIPQMLADLRACQKLIDGSKTRLRGHFTRIQYGATAKSGPGPTPPPCHLHHRSSCHLSHRGVPGTSTAAAPAASTTAAPAASASGSAVAEDEDEEPQVGARLKRVAIVSSEEKEDIDDENLDCYQAGTNWVRINFTNEYQPLSILLV